MSLDSQEGVVRSFSAGCREGSPVASIVLLLSLLLVRDGSGTMVDHDFFGKFRDTA